MRRFLAQLKSFLPDARDVHLYGGALLVCTGVWLRTLPPDWRVAIALFGAFLFYMGRPWR